MHSPFHLIEWLVDGYTWLWTFKDRRVDGWLLTSSVQPTLALLSLYLALVICGPRWMLHRPPFSVRRIVFAYNVSVTALNFYIFIQLATATHRLGYNWFCEPVRLSTQPQEMKIVEVLHLAFVSKVIELLDTVFIIGRKKSGQLTFLHVYHHSTVVFLSWMGIRWVPGGSGALIAVVNTFVHVVMYSYYALSTLGPPLTRYLWWKKYLTLLQLAQFVVGLVLGVNGFLIDCAFPTWMHYTNLAYMMSYVMLFGHFYVKHYVSSRHVVTPLAPK